MAQDSSLIKPQTYISNYNVIVNVFFRSLKFKALFLYDYYWF